jgi:hypothetical protein
MHEKESLSPIHGIVLVNGFPPLKVKQSLQVCKNQCFQPSTPCKTSGYHYNHI